VSAQRNRAMREMVSPVTSNTYNVCTPTAARKRRVTPRITAQAELNSMRITERASMVWAEVAGGAARNSARR